MKENQDDLILPHDLILPPLKEEELRSITERPEEERIELGLSKKGISWSKRLSNYILKLGISNKIPEIIKTIGRNSEDILRIAVSLSLLFSALKKNEEHHDIKPVKPNVSELPQLMPPTETPRFQKDNSKPPYISPEILQNIVLSGSPRELLVKLVENNKDKEEILKDYDKLAKNLEKIVLEYIENPDKLLEKNPEAYAFMKNLTGSIESNDKEEMIKTIEYMILLKDYMHVTENPM